MNINKQYAIKLWSYLRKLFKPSGDNILIIGKVPLVVALILSQSTSNAQTVDGKNNEVKQLSIAAIDVGDMISEDIWNMSFEVVKYGEKSKKVQLKEYRGKVIILDYWATWCTSCILAMPTMHNLVKSFSDDIVLISVTHEDQALVSKFLMTTASPQIRELEHEFETIVNGQLLKELIPHQTIPHLAIINSEGILEQITKPVFINEKMLGQLIKKQSYYLPKYHASLDTTILSPTFPDLKIYKPTFYSTLTGYIDGFMFPWGERVDTVAGTRHGFYVNSPILRLFQTALNPKFNMMMPNRRLMLVDKPENFEFFNDRNPNYDRLEYNFSYEYILPLTWSKERIGNKMLQDLSDFTGLYAQIVPREVDCLVIRKIGNGPLKANESRKWQGLVLDGILLNKIPQHLGTSASGSKNYVLKSNIKSLTRYLNVLKKTVLPVIFDESDIGYAVDLELPNELGDVAELKKIMKKQGLEFVSEVRILDLYVMSDRPIDLKMVKDAPLTLTTFGWVINERGSDD